jgi:phage terminase large subunit-like protein
VTTCAMSTDQIEQAAETVREQAAQVAERIYAGADFPGADDIIALAHSLTTLALAVADLASHTHAAKASIAILAP